MLSCSAVSKQLLVPSVCLQGTKLSSPINSVSKTIPCFTHHSTSSRNVSATDIGPIRFGCNRLPRKEAFGANLFFFFSRLGSLQFKFFPPASAGQRGSHWSQPASLCFSYWLVACLPSWPIGTFLRFVCIDSQGKRQHQGDGVVQTSLDS